MRFVPLLFLMALASCATYPRHTEPEPLAPPRSGAPVEASAVRLLVAPLRRTERCNPGYYYRLSLFPTNLGSPAAWDRGATDGHDLGDVRSPNVALTAAQADAIERAWWEPADWPPTSVLDCSSRLEGYAGAIEHGRPDDDAAGRPLVERALAALRTQAGAAGANEIADVRCYVVANTLNVTPQRLWCEGVARVR